MDYSFKQCKYNYAKQFPVNVNLIILVLLSVSQQLIQITETSNLPLLSASLRTFQAHACDGQQLILECLPNTVINIYLVNYGRTTGSQVSNNLCQQSTNHQLSSSSSFSSPTHNDKSSPLNPSKMIALEATSSSYDPAKLINQTAIHSKPDCQTTDNLKYSLLNKVEEACREKQICKIMTDPGSFAGIDPCPGITKYAEVAYKCRPNTFYNKIVCEDNKMRLSCKKYQRIMIYSAFFGSTKTGVVECPQGGSSSPSKGNHEECSISLTTEKVVASCNGLRNCELIANRETFDKPGCSKSTRLHLKIVYACVRREVLKSSIGKSSSPGTSSSLSPGGSSEMIYPDEVTPNEQIPGKSSYDSSTVDYSGYMGAPRVAPEEEDKDSSSQVTPPSSVISSESYLKSKESLNDPIRVPIKDGLGASLPDSHDPYHNKSTLFHPKKALGFMVDWLSAYKFIKDKTEIIIICLIMSIVVASLLFLVFLSTNQLIIQRFNLNGKPKNQKKPCSPKKSSPFAGSKGRCEVDGLDDTTVDQLLEELDPVLVHSVGIADPLSNMAISSSHHSFHDFRAHSKPLITDGLPYPAHSGQTLSFTSSLSRGAGNRLSFGRPIQPPTAPMTITPASPTSINCHLMADSNPRAMSGTVNSYF
ncbi:protein eva-1 [Tetranychus urticae]|uniref:SUEL-type lectin domain-containing protein n=1 Tax=Tetranychus urticae TaxID=32264 RepID=T1KWB8_TETUR|nr:protein eva-1 [Tetranychus urticae]